MKLEHNWIDDVFLLGPDFAIGATCIRCCTKRLFYNYIYDTIAGSINVVSWQYFAYDSGSLLEEPSCLEQSIKLFIE
jgi:hypothetical protein